MKNLRMKYVLAMYFGIKGNLRSPNKLPSKIFYMKLAKNTLSLEFYVRYYLHIYCMYYCNWIRTHNHLVHKRTLNHLAKLAK